jgi:hypothetical protein
MAFGGLAVGPAEEGGGVDPVALRGSVAQVRPVEYRT